MTSVHRLTTVALMAASVTVGACHRNNAAEHVQKADAFFAQSRYAEAAIEYRVALSTEPKRGDIRTKLADTLLRQNESVAALKEYVRAADLLPNDATAQVRAGSLLLMAHAFDDARARADQAIAIDPKNTDALVLRGNALAGLKDFDGALNQFQEALVLNPNEETAQRNVGALQMTTGHPAEAEASYRKAIQISPKSVQAHLALASFLWGSRRASEAEQVLKDTVALAPSDPVANRALGVFYIANGRAAEAEPYFQALAKSNKSTEGTLALADYYVSLKRLDQANKVLADLAARDASSAAAVKTRQASIQVLQGNRSGAMQKVQEVVDAYPKESPARLLMARLQLMDGKPKDALTTVSSLVADDPNGPVAADAFQLEGDIQASLDRPGDAMRAYQEVIKRDPRAFAAYLGLATVNLADGALDKAATYAEQAQAAQPGNPRARALMARVYLAQNNQAKASETIASLRKDFPNSPTGYDLLAAQEATQHHVDAERAAYVKAAALAPGDLEALSGLQTLDFALGRPKDAQQRIDGVLKATPHPSGALLLLAASTYARLGDHARTEQILKQAIEAEPFRLEPYSLLGALYVGEKRLDDARDQFTEEVKRDPRSVAANTMLGMILEMQNRTSEAEQQYAKTVAADPNATIAANNLAWIYVTGNRNLDQALQLAQSAVQANPGEPHFQDTLCWIYYKKDMAPQAIEHGEASIKGLPKDPGGHYHLGMAYMLDNQLEPAKTQLQQALSLSPSFEGSDDAKKALAKLGS